MQAIRQIFLIVPCTLAVPQLVGESDRVEDVCLFDGPQLTWLLVRVIPEQEARNVVARIRQLLLRLSK